MKISELKAGDIIRATRAIQNRQDLPVAKGDEFKVIKVYNFSDPSHAGGWLIEVAPLSTQETSTLDLEPQTAVGSSMTDEIEKVEQSRQSRMKTRRQARNMFSNRTHGKASASAKLAVKLLDKGYVEEARMLLADDESDDSGIREELIQWILENPNPEDEKLHTWAEGKGYNVHEIEDQAYKLVTEYLHFLKGGKANKIGYTGDDLPEDILKLGMEVEAEHTDDPEQQKRIVLDHAAEYADKNGKVDPEKVRQYYEGIKALEKKIKGE